MVILRFLISEIFHTQKNLNKIFAIVAFAFLFLIFVLFFRNDLGAVSRKVSTGSGACMPQC